MKEANDYRLPEIDLLTEGNGPTDEERAEIRRAREVLRKTLENFGIPGEVTGFVTGPRTTRFEIALAPGVSVKKIERIADNIAMDLAVPGVRVLAPIPGTPRVGVEVPKTQSGPVLLRDVLGSGAWQNGKEELPVAIGMDISGKPVVLDLAKAPQLLVSGATGTGKSVCIDALIASLLFKFRPDELKFVMIDPKVIEFEEYRELPHLLAPIVTDPDRTATALRWVAGEVDRRYEDMAKVHVRKFAEFNRRPPDPKPVCDAGGIAIPAKLPYIVVVIDELADLMATKAKRDIETHITRIAQKGRAAGIHLVVATQRPSHNVITGVIKANFPTRICFQVRSCADSRVVLDCRGAEQLLGTGDMLLSGHTGIERVQGALVPNGDLRKIVEFVCKQAKPQFEKKEDENV